KLKTHTHTHTKKKKKKDHKILQQLALYCNFYAHLKPDGTFLSQAFRIKLSEMGTFRLMPNTLALTAVQRQTAASRSVKPPMRVQHGFFESGVPTTMPTKSFSKFAQAPNLRVSLGH
ncbi:hypothetical protein MIMGU_mgv1a019851mg, partial [Erythranthe guttata]